MCFCDSDLQTKDKKGFSLVLCNDILEIFDKNKSPKLVSSIQKHKSDSILNFWQVKIV